MDKLVVAGGKILSGEVKVSGSKNAALPILFASILCPEKIEFENVPRLKDIDTTFQLLRKLGVQIDWAGEENSPQKNLVIASAAKIQSVEAPYDLVRTMRASVLALGPLLAREKMAKVSLPGGCAIGTRPVDLHLFGLEKMGAKFELKEGYIHGSCPGGLQGALIEFRLPSVGATENIMMAATLAKGKTIIRNAAREPEIVNLAQALRAMGAIISGDGTDEIVVEGRAALRGAKVRVMFDRIEAGTLLLAGPITGGKVKVLGAEPSALQAYIDVLNKIGLYVRVDSDGIFAEAKQELRPTKIVTAPFPGFPTDLQAQMMCMLTQVPGQSEIEETIFENRYMHVPELNRLGAHIDVQGPRAIIQGAPGKLQGAVVMATDLRASASLVLAGLVARGAQTHIRRIYHLDRGYERLEEKLSALGANIERRKDSE